MAIDKATVAKLDAQKRRALARILEVKDDCDYFLPEDLSHRLRKAVLDAVNDMHICTVEIVDAADEGMSVNELLLHRAGSVAAARGRT